MVAVLSGTPFLSSFWIRFSGWEALSVPSFTYQHSNTVRYFVSVVQGGWGLFRGRVTTPISVQCHSCKQSDDSVLADLTTSALPVKKSGIVPWPVSRPHLARLLDSPASQPGGDVLHMARNLFCCYRPPPASISNSYTFITALCSCSFVSQLFSVCPHTWRDFRSL